MSWDQAGIYKVKLFETLGLTVLYSEESDSMNVSTTGNEIELSQSDNIYIDFSDKISIGANGKNIHEYLISSTIFDFTQSTLDKLEDLSSVFGYVAVIYFRNGDIKLCLAPFFLTTDISYDESKTQAFNFILTNNVLTNEELQNYYEFESGQEILSEDGSVILSESGASILSE